MQERKDSVLNAWHHLSKGLVFIWFSLACTCNTGPQGFYSPWLCQCCRFWMIQRRTTFTWVSGPHFLCQKSFTLFPPPPRQPLALGTYATNKCSYNLFIIKIVSPLPSTPPQGGYIMQKSLHQQCQVTVRTPVSVKTSKPFMCLFS